MSGCRGSICCGSNKAFASQKAVTKRLDALEKEKILGSKSLITEKSEHGGRRAKRSTNETDIRNALMKLKKLEERQEELN